MRNPFLQFLSGGKVKSKFIAIAFAQNRRKKREKNSKTAFPNNVRVSNENAREMGKLHNNKLRAYTRVQDERKREKEKLGISNVFNKCDRI